MRPYSFLYLAPCSRRRPVTCHAPRALRVWSARGRCCAGIGRSCVGSGGRRPARADARLRRPRCGPSCCGWLARSATSTPPRRVPSWPPDRARARRGQGAAPHRTSDLDGAREPAPTLAASTGRLDIEASVVAVVRRSASGDGEQQGDLLALLEALRRPACTPPITGSTERSAGARSGSLSRRRAEIVDGRTVLELERERRRVGEPGQPAAETDTHLYCSAALPSGCWLPPARHRRSVSSTGPRGWRGSLPAWTTVPAC